MLVICFASASAGMTGGQAWATLETLAENAARDVPAAARKINFYQNARRRDPSAEELKPIVKINTRMFTCAGFFVKNRANDFLIATARHCALYRFEKVCKEDGVEVITAAGGFRGRCERVIAEGTYDDMVVFKARFSNPDRKILKSIGFLALSAVTAPQGMPLTVIGYPSDQYRNRRLTLTENCWANDGASVNDLLTPAENMATEKAAERSRKYFRTMNEDYEAYIGSHKFMSARAQHQSHNCTTYQGNSGGPFLWSGRSIAFGMPGGSHQDVYRAFPETASNKFLSTVGFARNNRLALEQAGVVLVDVLPSN